MKLKPETLRLPLPHSHKLFSAGSKMHFKSQRWWLSGAFLFGFTLELAPPLISYPAVLAYALTASLAFEFRKEVLVKPVSARATNALFHFINCLGLSILGATLLFFVLLLFVDVKPRSPL